MFEQNSRKRLSDCPLDVVTDPVIRCVSCLSVRFPSFTAIGGFGSSEGGNYCVLEQFVLFDRRLETRELVVGKGQGQLGREGWVLVDVAVC